MDVMHVHPRDVNGAPWASPNPHNPKTLKLASGCVAGVFPGLLCWSVVASSSAVEGPAAWATVDAHHLPQAGIVKGSSCAPPVSP